MDNENYRFFLNLFWDNFRSQHHGLLTIQGNFVTRQNQIATFWLAVGAFLFASRVLETNGGLQLPIWVPVGYLVGFVVTIIGALPFTKFDIGPDLVADSPSIFAGATFPNPGVTDIFETCLRILEKDQRGLAVRRGWIMGSTIGLCLWIFLTVIVGI